MSTIKHTILYAEDDLDDLFILKQAFEKHNHIEVLHALDGRKALLILEEMLRSESMPCLVILDINMPVMNGREALQAIRSHERLQKLPVVLFSTSNSPADNAFAESHDSLLITKPIDFGDMETIIERFIDRCDFEMTRFETNGYQKNS